MRDDGGHSGEMSDDGGRRQWAHSGERRGDDSGHTRERGEATRKSIEFRDVKLVAMASTGGM